MFTEEKLKNSKEFKEWVTGNIALIHNLYHDTKEPYQTWIVISDENEYETVKNIDMGRNQFNELLERILGKWTITRFFEMNGKIQVSVDQSDISTDMLLKLLMTKYSKGLN